MIDQMSRHILYVALELVSKESKHCQFTSLISVNFRIVPTYGHQQGLRSFIASRVLFETKLRPLKTGDNLAMTAGNQTFEVTLRNL